MSGVFGPSPRGYITVGALADYPTSQFQTALTAAGPARATVLLKENVTISSTLQMPSYAGLEGLHPHTTITMAAAANQTVLQNSDTTNGNTGISIRNIRIDQQGATQSGGGGLSFVGLTDSTFDNIYIDFVKNHNFFISSIPGTTLTGTLSVTNGSQAVVGVGTSFTTEVSEGSILRITLTSGFDEYLRVKSVTDDTNLVLDRAWGWSSETGETFKLVLANARNKVTGCTFAGNDDDDNSGFGLLDDSLIMGNISFNAAGYGFGPDHTNNCRIANNVAYDCVNAGFGMETLGHSSVVGNLAYRCGTGLALVSGSYRNTLTANVSRLNDDFGISLPYNATAFPASSGNTLIGNHCFYNGQYGIRIGGVSRTTLTGNHCYNNVDGVVLATDSAVVSDKTIINANQCWDDQDTKTQVRGIRIVSGTNVLVTNNISLTADHTTDGILDSTGAATLANNLE